MSDDLAWASLFVGALGTVFLGIQALKAITVSQLSLGRSELPPSELPLSQRIYRSSPPVDYVICPNCGQLFDAAWSASYNVETVRVNGTHIISCPRCWYTFEACNCR